ncbi:fumarylacetoacetate hydrolase family protein [Skermanella rosea]|uniref:2-keto-4-pentenoate hydratase n=1 Tax=Skermanella rosea TaxID=1817965 RepID=UPI0019330673|nr:fumarylacetoacetate hydrolase family protein [Skermanella rosea]UEM02756.1 fumarylacetoacetate hydrolase family protein [Skermanella rosea]
MMTPESAVFAACELFAAHLSLRALDRLPDPLQPADEAEAYQVQEALNRKLSGAGFGELAGYKIGCTTAVMQAYLGIASPCRGGILSSTVAGGGAALNHAAFRRPGVECEIAVRLGKDVPESGAPYDRNSVAGFVECCMPAAEIVDDRYADWRTVGTPLLIADNFFGAGCVLGAPVHDWGALDEVAGSMLINGAVVGSGRGADVLGHPFEALAWLANRLAGQGGGLKAGDLVLTGSVVQTNWVAVGDRVVMDLGRLGAVELSFE